MKRVFIKLEFSALLDNRTDKEPAAFVQEWVRSALERVEHEVFSTREGVVNDGESLLATIENEELIGHVRIDDVIVTVGAAYDTEEPRVGDRQ